MSRASVFETNDNTNSTNGPSSSPTPPSPVESISSPHPTHPLPPIQLSNENDYPGRRSNTPVRRVSTVSDYGERDMSVDMDQGSDDISEPPTDPVYFQDDTNIGSDFGAPPSTDFEEDTEEEDEDDNEEMEITEAIAMSIDRKRSLSMAQQRELARRSSLSSHRLSSVRFSPAATSRPPEDETNEDEPEEDVTTNTQATQESEAPMEFTIALGQPLREPKPPSEEWLALEALVNGPFRRSSGDGNEDNGEDAGELSNALSRLQNARSSLGFASQYDAEQDDSFTNTESSVDMSMDAGDRTLNVTALMGRVSSLEISGDDEGNTGRLPDEDLTGPHAGNTAPLNIRGKDNAPKDNASGQVPASPRSQGPSIFTALTSSKVHTATASASENENEVPQRSQTSGAPKGADPSRPPLALKSSLRSSIFTAAPSNPSRIPVFVSPTKPKAVFTASLSKKRPGEAPDAVMDAAHPSPAKKRHIEDQSVPNAPESISAPAPISEEAPVAPSTEPSAPRESLGGLRRPFGYFAQRRSLTPGLENAPNASRSPSPAANAEPSGAQSVGAPSALVSTVGLSTQFQDGNAVPNAGQRPPEPVRDKLSTFGVTFAAPTIAITTEPVPESGLLSEAMEVDTGKQAIVQRRSLVSPDMAPPDDEYDDVVSGGKIFCLPNVLIDL